MEENKQFKQFGVFEIPKDKKSEVFEKIPVSERSRGSTSTQSINTDKTYNVNIGKGVTIHLGITDSKFTEMNLATYSDVLILDKYNPDLIHGFTPPLYKEFVVKNRLLNHVNIGDKVIINPRYKERDGDKPQILKDIYFKSLNNMTVLIGILDNGDITLYNRLQLCK